MEKFFICLGLIFPCVLASSAKAEFEFPEIEFDDSAEALRIQDLKNLGPHTHYHCTSERAAIVPNEKKATELKPSDLDQTRGRFDLIYSETYDIPLQSMYGILEDTPVKKWFFLYGSYSELNSNNKWIHRDFDLHTMIKVPSPVSAQYQEAPWELETPFDHQATHTNAFRKTPWSQSHNDTILYAGGTVPGIGQFDTQHLFHHQEVLHELDTTYVTFKAPSDFAQKNQRPTSFVAEVRTLYREGFNEKFGPPLAHLVTCNLQDNLEEVDLKAVLGRSKTYDMESHLSDDWDFHEAGGIAHREVISDLAKKENLPLSLLWAMAQTLSDPDLRIRDSRLLSWQSLSVAATALLSYTLLRGQGALLARSTQNTLTPLPILWRGHTVPPHDHFSLKDVSKMAESLFSAGQENLPHSSSLVSEELVQYSLEVFESVRAAQALEWQKICPNPDLCS